jgi:hypothetical protein
MPIEDSDFEPERDYLRSVDRDLEFQKESWIPRISVPIPEPPTLKLTADEIKRYETSKLIIGNPNDPDVQFRKKVDTEYETKVREAYVAALVGIVLNQEDNPSLVQTMVEAGNARVAKEKELLNSGVLPTEISHAPDKFRGILKVGKEGSHTHFQTLSDGFEEPMIDLDVSTQINEGMENKSINLGLTQTEGLWKGRVDINIPLSLDETKNSFTPDALNARITNASGTLQKVSFVEAAKLMIDMANRAVDSFNFDIQEADAVFKDAEERHGSR